MGIFENLGKALRWLRDRRGKKQYQVAEAAGITKGMLCAYETGKQRPSLDTLEKLLQALGCDLVELHEALALVNGRYAPAGAGGGRREPAPRRAAYPLGPPDDDEVADVTGPETVGQMVNGVQALVHYLEEALQRLPPVTGDERDLRLPHEPRRRR